MTEDTDKGWDARKPAGDEDSGLTGEPGTFEPGIVSWQALIFCRQAPGHCLNIFRIYPAWNLSRMNPWADFTKRALTGFLLLLGLQIYACSNQEPNDHSSAPDLGKPVSVETSPVEQRDLPEIIRCIGTLEAAESVEIRPEVAGIVRQVHFREGQPVNAGHLLFTIDDAKIRKRLQARQAALAGAEVEMRTAGRIYQRRLELLAQKVVAPETVDEVRLEFKAAQARVDRLLAEISEIKETLADTRVRSPISGTAGERQVDAGDYVARGDHLVDIVYTRRLKLFFAVPERFMGRVRPDQTVHIRIPAFPGPRIFCRAPHPVRNTRSARKGTGRQFTRHAAPGGIRRR